MDDFKTRTLGGGGRVDGLYKRSLPREDDGISFDSSNANGHRSVSLAKMSDSRYVTAEDTTKPGFNGDPTVGSTLRAAADPSLYPIGS